MGSYSRSDSTAIDNRLAVTDEAFGLSSSGTGNNTALEGHIFNINAGTKSPSTFRDGAILGGGSGGGGASGSGAASISLNVLDGGVINRSFDFASQSLSDILAHLITGQQTQQQAAQYTADTIGQALTQSAQANAAAAAGQSAVASTMQEKTQNFIVENGKKIVIGLVVAGAAYWFWGRKK